VDDEEAAGQGYLGRLFRGGEARLMKVHIVCYEDVNSWILGKFARKMKEELEKLSVDVSVSNRPDPAADVNHHIIYTDYDGKRYGLDTVMITHIDQIEKVKLLRSQLQTARMGVCMSRETMESLANAGVPRDRLCFINPAHDSVMRPRKLVLGITSKTHPDGRKKEGFLVSLASRIDTRDFRVVIMGSGWQSQVETATALGLDVEYHPEFDRDKYITLMPTFDYYVYFSHDEGSMGYLDALAAGVKTIVTPQGYHLDAVNGITHAINDCDDLVRVCTGISAERGKLTGAVKDWTWARYAQKHLELWEVLLDPARKPAAAASGVPGDGVQSMRSGAEAEGGSLVRRAGFYYGLYRNSIGLFLKNSSKVRKAKRLLGLGSHDRKP
jgi:hypothetical protein